MFAGLTLGGPEPAQPTHCNGYAARNAPAFARIAKRPTLLPLAGAAHLNEFQSAENPTHVDGRLMILLRRRESMRASREMVLSQGVFPKIPRAHHGPELLLQCAIIIPAGY